MKTGRLAGFTKSLPRFSDKGQRRAAGNIIKFLAALLALTLIARGTSGATLTRVELSAPSRAEITDAVTGSADVSAVDTLDVKVPEGLTVSEMFAGVGQSVNADDALALFDMDEVREMLIRETAKLDKLRLDLSRLNRSEYVDASARAAAQRSLLRAQEDLDSVMAQGEADVAAALEDFEDAMEQLAEDPDSSALENARRTLRRAQEDYDSAKAQGEADIADAQNAYNTALNEQVEYPDGTSVDSAQRTLQRARDDYDEVKAQGDADIALAQKNVQDALDAGADEAEIEAAKATLEAVRKKAESDLISPGRRVEDAQASLEKAKSDYWRSYSQSSETLQSEIERAKTALDSAKNRARENLLSAERRVEDAQASLDKAGQDYAKNADKASDDLLNEIDRAYAAFETAENRARENLLSAERRVEDAQYSFDKAEQDHGRSAQQASDTEAQNSISAVTLLLDIDDQKAVVDGLSELYHNDGMLYSPLAGVVSAAMSAGGMTGASPLVSFLDGAKGFEAVLTLGKSDAEKLSVGDECQVTTGGGSMYYNPTVTGTVSSITAPDQNDRVSVTIRLPDGSWTRGQRVEVQAVMSRDTYDLCVPLSALRSDNSGYYILTVEQASTVLGIENVVVRTAVTVNASNDDMAAVSGPVGRDSKVITGSSKAVKAGDRVRVS